LGEGIDKDVRRGFALLMHSCEELTLRSWEQLAWRVDGDVVSNTLAFDHITELWEGRADRFTGLPTFSMDSTADPTVDIRWCGNIRLRRRLRTGRGRYGRASARMHGWMGGRKTFAR
jgi:hypothetical protein